MQTTSSEVRQVPEPQGDAAATLLSNFAQDTLGTAFKGFQLYGPIVKYPLGPVTMIVLSDPELARAVLIGGPSEFHKLDIDRGLGLLMGEALLTFKEHEPWFARRRMMQPMFHRQYLATMGERMVQAGENMLARWQAKDEIDVSYEMMEVTLDIINQTMFSTNVLEDVDKIGPATKQATVFLQAVGMNPQLAALPSADERVQAFLAARQTLDDVIYGIIHARRSDPQPRNDLLDLLMQARDADTGEGMTDEQLRNEVLDIFAAGHETTAHTLTWGLYLLTQHPDVFARLHAEVDTVLAGRTPTVSDLSALPYTQRVFNEIMRFYPVAPLVPRMAHSDAILGGYAIPAGTRLLVDIYNIHHNPAFWSEPETFDPDRFLPERSKGRHPQAFLPFSIGSRKCIGSNLAEMEGPLLLAMIAQHYDLELIPDQRIEPVVTVTLRPRYGLRVRLHPRAVRV
ncbi:MAG TPA: cytochrome P450 [Ktedonobacteraceae bacterium]|nr:cytochrome P450 [Ktedonobacteraceae bacterium]